MLPQNTLLQRAATCQQLTRPRLPPALAHCPTDGRRPSPAQGQVGTTLAPPTGSAGIYHTPEVWDPVEVAHSWHCGDPVLAPLGCAGSVRPLFTHLVPTPQSTLLLQKGQCSHLCPSWSCSVVRLLCWPHPGPAMAIVSQSEPFSHRAHCILRKPRADAHGRQQGLTPGEGGLPVSGLCLFLGGVQPPTV